jgi:hypothetical protein
MATISTTYLWTHIVTLPAQVRVVTIFSTTNNKPATTTTTTTTITAAAAVTTGNYSHTTGSHCLLPTHFNNSIIPFVSMDVSNDRTL